MLPTWKTFLHLPSFQPLLSFTSFYSLSFIPLNRYNASTSNKNIPRRFQNRQKNRQKLFTPQEKQIQYSPYQALQLMRLHSFTSFKQSIDFCVRLNVNPKNGEQIVRGSCSMPAGLGKTVKIAVLCSKEQYEELLGKGVVIDKHIHEGNIKQLEKGELDFQRMFTTVNHIHKIKHLGKILGPKGLMPNAKMGTIVTFEKLPATLKEAKAGQVTFRVDNGKNIHVMLGKIDFTDDQVITNLNEVMKALSEKKPAGLKGKYFLEAYLKSTMGPRWKLNSEMIDPRSSKSVWSLMEKESQENESV